MRRRRMPAVEDGPELLGIQRPAEAETVGGAVRTNRLDPSLAPIGSGSSWARSAR